MTAAFSVPRDASGTRPTGVGLRGLALLAVVVTVVGCAAATQTSPMEASRSAAREDPTNPIVAVVNDEAIRLDELLQGLAAVRAQEFAARGDRELPAMTDEPASIGPSHVSSSAGCSFKRPGGSASSFRSRR
jgi:hypothetical protein